MAIALIITDRNVAALRTQLEQNLEHQIPVWIYPDIPEPAAVRMAVVWKHPAGVLAGFPNLQVVSSFGAGVEHIMQDQDLPPGITVSRIVDDSLSLSMRNYVLMAVLNIQRQFRHLQKNQQAGTWIKPDMVELPLHIGVLGLGALGGRIAGDLAALGFRVSGFSQRPKRIPGVATFSEKSSTLPEFVSHINVLVNVLPRTPATEGILNLPLLSQLPLGSFLINVGRGVHLVETDLLSAVGQGYIQEAWLDVFATEPLPPNHAFWRHPQIVITPHIASVTNQLEAGRIIAGNYRRMEKSEPLMFEVNRTRGY